jgi:ABC-type uncharacterized transport system permease subunit
VIREFVEVCEILDGLLEMVLYFEVFVLLLFAGKVGNYATVEYDFAEVGVSVVEVVLHGQVRPDIAHSDF